MVNSNEFGKTMYLKLVTHDIYTHFSVKFVMQFKKYIHDKDFYYQTTFKRFAEEIWLEMKTTAMVHPHIS